MVGIKWIVLLFLNVTFSYTQDPIAPPWSATDLGTWSANP